MQWEQKTHKKEAIVVILGTSVNHDTPVLRTILCMRGSVDQYVRFGWFCVSRLVVM